MSTTVTILDIAREAGVSPSTVSRVLNGNAPVAADKRAAVLSVVEKLHYRPNAFAQGLVRGRHPRCVGPDDDDAGHAARAHSSVCFAQRLMPDSTA